MAQDAALLDGRYRLVRRRAATPTHRWFDVHDEVLGLPLVGFVLRRRDDAGAARMKRVWELLSGVQEPGLSPLRAFVDDGRYVALIRDDLRLPSLEEIWSLLPASRRKDPGARWASLKPVFAGLLDLLERLAERRTVLGCLAADRVLVTHTGRPVLVDPLFAVHRDDAGAASTALESLQMEAPLLAAAPELLAGGAVSPRTDLYSLGVLAYQFLAGRPPWVADSHEALRAVILEREPVPVSVACAGLDARVADAITSMLQRDPTRRPLSATALRDQLGLLPGAARAGEPVQLQVPTVLVGSLPEREALHERMRGWLKGHGRVVRVVGAAGAGKTRLMAHLAEAAATLQIEGVEGGVDVRRVRVDRQSALQGFGFLRPRRVGTPWINDPRPSVVLVDGLEHLDGRGRRLVGRLASFGLRPDRGPVALVAAGAKGSRKVPELEEQEADELSPPELDVAAVRTLLSGGGAAGAGGGDPRLESLLYGVAGDVAGAAFGHPGRTMAGLEEAVRESRLVRDGLLWALPSAWSSAAGTPRSVGAEERDRDCDDLVRWVIELESPVEVELLLAAQPMPPERILRGLERGLEQGGLRLENDGRWAWLSVRRSSDRPRPPAMALRDAHLAVAQWLQSVSADPDLAGERIGRHYRLAGRPDDSAHWLLRAAVAYEELGFESDGRALRGRAIEASGEQKITGLFGGAR